ncbi:1027_t:CDS:2 [Funneliformis caledonium]|uniref:1027_t:CDS:1 n=1 Tax=Funneliformis caledonium TaxID=1117310 RepID=A0A9N8V963_9GLOM|nr:1027_t:CDS:2 [Funneliformis caledonium]
MTSKAKLQDHWSIITRFDNFFTGQENQAEENKAGWTGNQAEENKAGWTGNRVTWP